MFTETVLGDVLDFYNGKAIKPGGEGRYPVYGSNGIIGGFDDYRYEDGIVVGRVGAYCGSIAYCRGRFWASDNTIVAKPKRTNDSTRFFAYMLLAMNLNRHAGGAAQPLVTQSTLKAVPATVPDAATQVRIASILSAYDDLIENNTRRIAILEEMARRIYEEWFVRFRFPGHEGVRMVESELGLVPEGWSVAPLGDVVKLLSGFAFKSSTFSEDGSFGLVTIKNVHDGEFVEECTSRLSDPPLNMPQHCNLNVADILLSLTGNVGRCCLVTLAGCLLNQRVAKIEPIKSFDWAYSYLLFRSIQHRERLEAIANGVAQQNLSPVESQRMRLVIPAEAMRRRFAEVVTHLLRLRLTLDLKNTNLRTTRDLLLPKLISGELNVSAMPEPEALAI